jgi:hypothetical protein
VPAAKRPRTHGEARPPLGREQAARRSEQGSVAGRVPRPLPSAPEDRELLTQDDDLKLPLTAAADEHANNPAQQPVQQTRQHRASV